MPHRGEDAGGARFCRGLPRRERGSEVEEDAAIGEPAGPPRRRDYRKPVLLHMGKRRRCDHRIAPYEQTAHLAILRSKPQGSITSIFMACSSKTADRLWPLRMHAR